MLVMVREQSSIKEKSYLPLSANWCPILNRSSQKWCPIDLVGKTMDDKSKREWKK